MFKDNSQKRLLEVVQKLNARDKSRLNEDISIDVEVGDTIMTGRFKNKRTVVKTIGKDEHGMPTINGKKVVIFRKCVEDKGVVKEGDAFNDAGEPMMTHSQFRDHSEPAEPEYDDNQPPQQPQGMGNFRDVDWKTLHGIFTQNTEAFKQGKIGDGVTVNDLTDYDGYLSPEELQHLDNHSLVYIDGQFVVIDDDQYLDYNTFFNKAQEVWDKEADIQSSGNNDSEAPYMRGYEPMSENVTEKRLMEMMNKINPISKII